MADREPCRGMLREEDPVRLAPAMILSAVAASVVTYAFCPRAPHPPGGSAPPVEEPAVVAAPLPAPPPTVLQAPGRTSPELEQVRGELKDALHRLELAQAEVVRLRDLVGTSGGGGGGVEDAGVGDLVKLSARIRARTQELLLAPPAGVQTRYASLLARAGTGVARILPRGAYEQAIEKRGGGAYYSFATRDNSYDEEPDLELQQGNYSSSFYGGTWGCVLDLGAIALESVPESPAALPTALTEEQRPAWELLWQDAKTSKQGFSDDFKGAAAKLGLSRNRVPAVVGHTYVVRAILPGEHDHLVAFSPVEQDEFGHTLVWRVLRTWTVERRR